MTHSCETIIDQEGIELLVGYDWELSKQFYAEEGNPGTLVAPMIYTELTSVEVVIRGVGIDLLPKMNQKQTDYIKSLLTYED